MKEKIVLITGGTDGIGWETAKKLKDSKKVIILGRNFEKVKDKLSPYPNFVFKNLDLSDLD